MLNLVIRKIQTEMRATHTLEWMKLKRLITLSVDENVEYRISHQENIKLDSHFGKQFCIFLKF